MSVVAGPFSLQARRRARRRRGVTLVEVLATIVMMGIVLPAAMEGVSVAMQASDTARQRTEASALAEAKLAELVATGDWQFGALSGDFGDAWPEYRWGAMAQDWATDSTLKEISVRVVWTRRGQERQVALTTLVYQGQTGAAGF
jgi:prepilin-type N-terminal cleavage/methylation domain-containing protein